MNFADVKKCQKGSYCGKLGALPPLTEREPFNSLNGEEWLDNVKLRIAPATRRMHGYRGAFWLQDPATGKVISISFWESEEALRSNGPGLQNVPLRPGQDPSKIPSADAQEFYEVVYSTADLKIRAEESEAEATS